MQLFAAVVLVASGLAGIAVWAPRRLPVRVTALVLAALLMATAYASMAELLGNPKPVSMEWARAAEAEAVVLGSTVREGEAIYLWLQFDGIAAPKAYVLPWDRNTAQQLQDAQRQAGEQGTDLRMRRPLSVERNSGEAVFYAEPQPTLPPKNPLAESRTRP